MLGVAPDCGERTSQLLPQLEVFVEAVKAMLAPVLLVIERFWASGWVVPV